MKRLSVCASVSAWDSFAVIQYNGQEQPEERLYFIVQFVAHYLGSATGVFFYNTEDHQAQRWLHSQCVEPSHNNH